MNKPKLYLLPGTMCNERLWVELSQWIEPFYELIHIPIPKGKDFDEIAEALLPQFTEETVDILGFSLGGYLAAYFSAKYPSRVNKLFVVSNSPCALNLEEIQQRQATIRWVEANGYSGMSRIKAKSFLDYDNRNDDTLVNTLLEMDAELGEEVLLNQLRGTTERMDLGQALSVLKVPVCFYYSVGDPLVNDDWVDALTKKHACFYAVKQQGAGHHLPLETPEHLGEHILSWSK